jgi:hypothetical protein
MGRPPQHRQQSTDAEDHPPEPPFEPNKPGILSHSDPEPGASAGRAPLWLVAVIVLLVTGFVVLHVTGVFGPGAH